jgi:hypothetical protein
MGQTSNREIAPNTESPALPFWAKQMYSDRPDIGAVVEGYRAYYKTHPFVKNAHTQYYKRWLQAISRDPNGTALGDPITAEMADNEARFRQQSLLLPSSLAPNSQWTCVGPIDFDKSAASTSYAPGAAHVYTTEQSLSNPNVLYAGTANAGVWKSTDKGANWTHLTPGMALGSVVALEIDYTNENTVYFGGLGKLYKSTNGGTTWAQTGNASFNTLIYNIKDIVMSPINNQVLWFSSDKGLFRSSDGGTNWTLLMGGNWQEIEFKPANPSIMYAVKQPSNRTEFWKSTDSGLTWSIRANGWPGIVSATTSNFTSIGLNGATADRAVFGSNIQLGTATYPDFTIEMRVKSNGWSGDPAIFSNKNWANGLNAGFVLAGNTNGSTWKFNVGTGSARIDLNGGTINDGEWHHIAVVYSATGTKAVYQDGALVNSSTTVLSTAWTSALQMALGQDGTLNYGSAFPGQVAEVRVWGSALSASTMDAWRCGTVTAAHPNWANMISYWKCDAGTGSTLADSKGSNTGTLSGSYTWATSGNTLTCVTTNFAVGDEQKRTEIATTPAAPGIIYAFATGVANAGSGLYGIYVSHNSGESWTFNCCGTGPGGVPNPATNKNLCGWADDGSDDGGQYYYDLALEVNDADSNQVHVGAVNHWVSSDGGVNWTCPAKWSHSYKPDYVHADIHDIHFYGGDWWIACDGGIFFSNDGGANWNRKQLGIAGTDFWGFGTGHWDGADVMVGGTYHNGTLVKDKNTYINGWLSCMGGDNIFGAVNYGLANIIYEDYSRHRLSGNRATPLVDLGIAKLPTSSYVTGEEAEMEWNPTNYNQFYIAYNNGIWRTTDGGVTFDSLYAWTGGRVTSIEIARSNPDVIYASHYPGFSSNKKLYKSTNGGTAWVDVTPANSVFNNANLSAPFDIAVSSSNPDEIWLVRCQQSSSYNNLDGYKVFKSTNGGTTWTNLTTATLNGEYPTNIVYHRGSNGGVYIGTHRGVYYRNNAMADWQLFNNGLPVRIHSTQLVPDYKNQRLINGTDQSAWAVDFYEHFAPEAQISVDKFMSSCTRDTFYFVDHSALSDSNATWSWNFPGGTPATSNQRNPKVVYANPGTYSVSLNVTDAYGNSAQTLNNLVTVTGGCLPDTVPGLALSLDGAGDYAGLTALNLNSNSVTISAWIKRNGPQNDYAGIVFSRSGNSVAGLDIRNTNELRYHWNGAAYTFASGLIVPDNQWTHVALVVSPTNAKIYMNGVAATNTTAHAIEEFDGATMIGLDNNGGSRYFKGIVDEVCIYNRALSQNEIRELMHLTRNNPNPGTMPGADPTLVAYYQFNEATGAANDRVGLHHATMFGNATRVTSTGPFAGGTSYRTSVTGAGVVAFTGTGATLQFPATGTYPNGEVVVSRLHAKPDTSPGCHTWDSKHYWVVNNYGSNANFTMLTSANFALLDVPSTNAVAGNSYKLWKRPFYADGNTWGTSLSVSTSAGAGALGSVTYGSGNNVTNFGQFFLTNAINGTEISICQGDSAFIAGTWETTAGTYADTLNGSGGCDSILVTRLNVNGPTPTNIATSICQGDSIFAGNAWQTTAGIYSDIFPSGSGCDSLVITTVTVNPTASTTANASVCQGDSAYLGGNWQHTAGVYTDTYSNQLGCDSTVSTTLTILPLPSPNITQTNNILNANAIGNSYQWYLNGNPVSGATSATYTPTASGNYTVTVVDGNGCAGTSAAYIFTLIGIGQPQASWLEVFPNPIAQGNKITFRLKQSGIFNLQVYNGLGQRVIFQSLEGRVDVPTDRLATGVYRYVVTGLGSGAVGSFVLQ